ncbi:UNVERIFIED_ORG: hypothetical protein HNP28_001974 [Comamonas terrigena]
MLVVRGVITRLPFSPLLIKYLRILTLQQQKSLQSATAGQAISPPTGAEPHLALRRQALNQ